MQHDIRQPARMAQNQISEITYFVKKNYIFSYKLLLLVVDKRRVHYRIVFVQLVKTKLSFSYVGYRHFTALKLRRLNISVCIFFCLC